MEGERSSREPQVSVNLHCADDDKRAAFYETIDRVWV